MRIHEQDAGANISTVIVLLCSITVFQIAHPLCPNCRPHPRHGGVLERVPMVLYSSELYLCSSDLYLWASELYLWTGVIFNKYVFLFCKGKVFLSWCLVFHMLLLFCSGNISELCLLIYYTLANIYAKFQSSRLLLYVEMCVPMYPNFERDYLRNMFFPYICCLPCHFPVLLLYRIAWNLPYCILIVGSWKPPRDFLENMICTMSHELNFYLRFPLFSHTIKKN